MRVLSIGNSFSQDAHKWLHTVAKAHGYTMDTVNLYIGGCSLERHWNNFLSGFADYDLEGNNGEVIKKISLEEALDSQVFDIVTLQQVSSLSGKPQSYFPYLTNLADLVKQKQPDAKLYFHRTWSYEYNSTHPGFETYNHDRNEMFRRLYDASVMAAEITGADIIPTGDIIQALSEKTKEFNSKNGGISLYRDGFHLSLDYGRLVAACVWYKTLTGCDVDLQKTMSINKDFDEHLLEIILQYIRKGEQ